MVVRLGAYVDALLFPDGTGMSSPTAPLVSISGYFTVVFASGASGPIWLRQYCAPEEYGAQGPLSAEGVPHRGGPHRGSTPSGVHTLNPVYGVA